MTELLGCLIVEGVTQYLRVLDRVIPARITDAALEFTFGDPWHGEYVATPSDIG